MFIRSDGDNDEASASMNELALPDGEWISPPVSIKSGIAESSATYAEEGLADSFTRLDVTEPILGAAEVLESLHGKTDSDNNQVFDICAFCHDVISCSLRDRSSRPKDISFLAGKFCCER